MKKSCVLKKWLVVFLFTCCSFLAFSATALAAKQPAPSLPSSGLPAISDYDSGSPSRARSYLPARYDARTNGYVTSVKNQSPWGTCWAFGALSAGESSMIKKGIANSNIDLSEMHLAYFFFHPTSDPLGLTYGDTVNNYTGSSYLDTGGNNVFTMFALSKWAGAANESLVPYGSSNISKNYAYQDAAHLQNARFVNSKDTENVKKLILDYGAVSSSMYYDPYFLNQNGAYFFPRSYYHSRYGTNHIVSIVGWDDNYSRDNFAVTYNGSLIKPYSNGAWIVKNSYGLSEGDNGYIYISYEDATLSGSGGDFLAFAFDMEAPDNYDHNYQYDGSYGSNTLGLTTGSSISNMYTVKGNPNGNEKLEAVSFSVLNQNVRYSIQIYKNPYSGSPSSGTPMLSSPQTGTTTYSGYYTIPLKQQPIFNQGDTFSVVITLSSADGSKVNCFVDYTSNISGLQFISSSGYNKSYYKLASRSSWADLNSMSSGTTARIKAFTSNTSQAATSTDTITSTLKPPSISLSSLNYKTVQLKWKKVKNAKGYQVYRSTSKYGSYRRINTTSKLSVKDSSGKTGVTYYYKVRAYRILKGKKVYSKYSSIKSVTSRPGKTSITSLSAAGGRKVKIKWKKVSGATGYEVYRSTSSRGKYQLVKRLGKSSQISYTNKAPKRKTYYYKVRAYRNVSGKRVYGSFSGVKKVKVK